MIHQLTVITQRNLAKSVQISESFHTSSYTGVLSQAFMLLRSKIQEKQLKEGRFTSSSGFRRSSHDGRERQFTPWHPGSRENGNRKEQRQNAGHQESP